MSKTQWGRRHSDNRAYPKGPVPVSGGEFDMIGPPTKKRYDFSDTPHSKLPQIITEDGHKWELFSSVASPSRKRAEELKDCWALQESGYDEIYVNVKKVKDGYATYHRGEMTGIRVRNGMMFLQRPPYEAGERFEFGLPGREIVGRVQEYNGRFYFKTNIDSQPLENWVGAEKAKDLRRYYLQKDLVELNNKAVHAETMGDKEHARGLRRLVKEQQERIAKVG